MASHRPWHPSRSTPRARWKAIRERVFDRAGFRCESCGKAGRLECDHTQAMHLGGDPWALDNLQSLCRGCHIQKTRLERSPPKTQDQQDWAAFTAK